ncbi:amino acid/amide ABC transporter substrate-binding protein (HAAT family) [Saccharothrix saharensis]|uniref:Amino acid/amide ABC transporter substrate-binding protein (HAAT family) n=1 Tax=Saccharothrix saharensis TaxID=571190 RepID=A0A543JM58_9PSEU|nr:ABC transporter substrate-binding protein [Saccharothrix saharensis]TQM83926.1 amino acid/amide ABC transporter substrate-binding protein (HAAT family) [Saccharothrix saharensis]
MASHRAVLAVLSVVALAAVACRGGDGAAPQEGKGGIKVDFGVTSEPCPDTGHSDRGCIYLGSISDLTEGPFKTLAVPITDSQKAFWKRVNDQGGIGGYDVDVTTYVKDNKYNPQIHNQVYQEMKGKILALAQTLGSPTTAAILPDLESTQMVSVPASWTSLWGVEEVVLESGANYCVESMNSVDYAVDELGAKSVMAVHLPGDYGDDAAAGAKIAAEKRGVTFTSAVTQTGQDNQGGAIDAVLANKPDVVILTAGPTDAAVIIGQTAARGFKGKFIGTSPTWNQGLMQSPAAPAIKALYLQSAPWKSWATDSPGHKALREALPSVTPNDGYTAGWVWSYPLKAALQKAAENKDLTRAGVLAAVRQLRSVDYEGMLPEGAGNFAGNSNDAAFRQTLIYKPDEQAATGVGLVEDFFTGPTAKDFKFEKPCYT